MSDKQTTVMKTVSEKISEWTKSLIDELQVKTKAAVEETMNGQYYI